MQQVNESEISVEPRLADASKRFARVIVESSVFQRFEEASRRLRDDFAAWQLLTDYQQAQQLYLMEQSWRRVSEQEAERIEQSRRQMLANPTLKEYFDSQEGVLRSLKELNVYLTEQLGFDFAVLGRPAGGCCS